MIGLNQEATSLAPKTPKPTLKSMNDVMINRDGFKLSFLTSSVSTFFSKFLSLLETVLFEVILYITKTADNKVTKTNGSVIIIFPPAIIII